MAVDDLRDGRGEIGVGIDAVELAGLDQLPRRRRRESNVPSFPLKPPMTAADVALKEAGFGVPR
jgi:hypothetical protein